MNEAFQWLAITLFAGLLVIVFKRLGDVERLRITSVERLPEIGPPIGTSLPSVEVPLVEGDPFRPVDLSGQAWLMMFVTDSCAYCAEVLPTMTADALERAGVQLATFDISGNAKTAPSPYLAGYRLPGRAYVVARSGADELDQLGVSATPSFILVGADQVVVDKGLCGSESWNRLFPAGPEATSSDIRSEMDITHERKSTT